MHTKHENILSCQNPQFLNVTASSALKETNSIKYYLAEDVKVSARLMKYLHILDIS